MATKKGIVTVNSDTEPVLLWKAGQGVNHAAGEDGDAITTGVLGYATSSPAANVAFHVEGLHQTDHYRILPTAVGHISVRSGHRGITAVYALLSEDGASVDVFFYPQAKAPVGA